jgi:hypothetical protein
LHFVYVSYLHIKFEGRYEVSSLPLVLSVGKMTYDPSKDHFIQVDDGTILMCPKLLMSQKLVDKHILTNNSLVFQHMFIINKGKASSFQFSYNRGKLVITGIKFICDESCIITLTVGGQLIETWSLVSGINFISACIPTPMYHQTLFSNKVNDNQKSDRSYIFIYFTAVEFSDFIPKTVISYPTNLQTLMGMGGWYRDSNGYEYKNRIYIKRKILPPHLHHLTMPIDIDKIINEGIAKDCIIKSESFVKQ